MTERDKAQKDHKNTGASHFRLHRRRFLAGMAGLAAGLTLAGTGWSFAQETPIAGGILRIAQQADAQPNLPLANRAGNSNWRRAVFDTLTSLSSETGKPEPVLASAWEFSEDGRSITVTLREGVVFHTGRPFTAEDVVFSLEKLRDPSSASQVAPLAKGFTAIEATGTHEITIRSEAVITSRIFDVFELAAILDSETFEGLADGSQVVGTGPYTWQEWVPSASIRLGRNENYWLEGRPYLDGIEISVITDPVAQANAIRGRVDLTPISPFDALPFRNDPGYTLFNTPGASIYPIGIDVSRTPFDNKALRQAIGYAIDRQRIIDQVFAGSGDPSDLWWQATEPGTTEALRTHYHYDPDRARALIAEAGAEGAQVPITVIGLPAVQQIFEIVQNNLREVGLNPVGTVTEVTAFDQGQTAGELGPVFQQSLGLQGFSAATLVDALPALRDTNPSKFNPPRYRELKDALQAAGPEQYPAALQELAEFMLDEAFSHILVQSVPLNIRTNDLHGVGFTNIGTLLVTDAWLGQA